LTAPLRGLRVLDLTRLLPGPLATLRLAELGADVLKIEEPGAGDGARAMLQSAADRSAGRPSAFYRLVNRGKRETRLDLKSETGRTVLRALVRESHVLVESFRPGVMARLGLDYASLAKMDPALLEAAEDLGASRTRAFWLVTFPLSLPGIAAGTLLCFIPIVGEFVIPDLLAGSNSLMIGQTLWLEFFTNKDWPVASAAAVALLLLLVVPLALYDRLQRRRLDQAR